MERSNIQRRKAREALVNTAMEEILHQLRLVVYPIICKVLYIPGTAPPGAKTLLYKQWAG